MTFTEQGNTGESLAQGWGYEYRLSYAEVEMPLGPSIGGDKIAVVYILWRSEEIFERLEIFDP